MNIVLLDLHRKLQSSNFYHVRYKREPQIQSKSQETWCLQNECLRWAAECLYCKEAVAKEGGGGEKGGGGGIAAAATVPRGTPHESPKRRAWGL